MPFSGGKSAGTGENVNHFAGIRLRVNGTGNLIPTWSSLDGAKSKQLVSITMASAPGKEPFRLGGFVSQRAFLELKTTNINETFKINRIVIFAKALWTGYSG